GPTRPITRSQMASHRNVKAIPHLSRDERRELTLFRAQVQADRDAEKLRNKWSLSQDLPASAPHVFFCEVGAGHPDQRSSLLGALGAGGAQLCYAHYNNGASQAFSHCPITAHWYVGPPLGVTRVPKGIVITGTSGPVRFCFWHAPS